MSKGLHIGTSGWSYKDWLGPFYPPGTKQSDYLAYYSRLFNTVEIDSTFYAIPRITTVENWFNITPEQFSFAPKVPKIITHDKRLQNCQDEWKRYVETMQILQQKLGPVVMQFDYKFVYEKHFEILEQFFQEQKYPIQLCVEIRHRSWHRPDFYNMIENYNVALVLNDLYYMPRIVQETADFTYVRLLGNRKQIPDDFTHVRVDREKDFSFWEEKIRGLLDKELEVYVYSNNRYQGHAPATIRTLMERLA